MLSESLKCRKFQKQIGNKSKQMPMRVYTRVFYCTLIYIQRGQLIWLSVCYGILQPQWPDDNQLSAFLFVPNEKRCKSTTNLQNAQALEQKGPKRTLREWRKSSTFANGMKWSMPKSCARASVSLAYATRRSQDWRRS